MISINYDHGRIWQSVKELIIQILSKIRDDFHSITMIRSGHNFAYATTAEQNCDVIGSSESKLGHEEFSQDFNHEFMNLCEMRPRLMQRWSD